MKALVGQNSTERQNLEQTFQQEESSIEADLREQMRKVQVARDAKDEEARKSMWEIVMNRTQPMESANMAAFPAEPAQERNADSWDQSASRSGHPGRGQDEVTATKQLPKPRTLSLSQRQQQPTSNHIQSYISSAKSNIDLVTADKSKYRSRFHVLLWLCAVDGQSS